MIYFVVIGGKYIRVLNAQKKESAIKRAMINSKLSGGVNVKVVSLDELQAIRTRDAAHIISRMFSGCTFINYFGQDDGEIDLKNAVISGGYIK